MKMAVVVRYCVAQGEPWRTGISIVPEPCSCDIGVILDAETYRAVEGPIWDFSVCYIYGAMALPPDTVFKGKGR